MKQKTVKLAAIFGILAVLLGAFGAHGLSMLLEEKQMETFKTGVLYHFIHTLVILVVGLLNQSKNRNTKFAVILFSLGIICFSGSLYLLSCRNILGIEGWTFLGPMTPIGGLLFVLGWASLFFFSTKDDPTNQTKTT
ncbi:MAG: DUF423 domain-containing protein [Saprospiraceae bacterium]